MAASGRVYFEAGADLGEFLSFPAGKHDDDVDTASLIGRAIDQAHPAVVASAVKPNNPPDLKRWRPRTNGGDNWKTV
jgi:hypothetical protein